MKKVDDFSMKDFDDAGNLVHYWIDKATQLLTSSKFLQINCIDGRMFLMSGIGAIDYADDENNHFFDVSLMLRGMAIECFLKAILIKNGKIIFKDGKMKPGYGDHSLYKMALDSGIKLNSIEKEVLDLLSIKIYLGRYPVFKNVLKYSSLPVVPNSKIIDKNGRLSSHKGQYWTTELEVTFEKLLKKVYSLL